MSSVVFFDCESDCSFQDVGPPRSAAFGRMQATVVCALVVESKHCESPNDGHDALVDATSHTFWRDQNNPDHGPYEPLLTLFDKAECIVAYNGLDFDFPLLRKHYGLGKMCQRRYIEHRSKCHDPFAKLRAATDVWFRLDQLLKVNNLPVKTGTGLEAIKLWHEDKRVELEAYCQQDVASMVRMTMLETLLAPGVGSVHNRVHGVASALAGIRAVQPAPIEEGYVVVQTGAPQMGI